MTDLIWNGGGAWGVNDDDWGDGNWLFAMSVVAVVDIIGSFVYTVIYCYSSCKVGVDFWSSNCDTICFGSNCGGRSTFYYG